MKDIRRDCSGIGGHRLWRLPLYKLDLWPRLFLLGWRCINGDGCGAHGQCGNAGEAGFQFTVLLLETGYTLMGGRELLFELSHMAAIFGRLLRMTLGLTLGFDGGKRGSDRGKIDLGECARRCQALAAL